MPARFLIPLCAASCLFAQTAPESASVAGTVTNSVTGEPVVRAHVKVQCQSPERPMADRIYGALTNEKGEFSVTPLPAQHCWINTERTGFVQSSGPPQNLELTAGAHKRGIKIALVPTGAITGRVLNAAGEPVQGIYVSTDGPGNGSASSDDQGQFRIGGLTPGQYRIRASPQRMPYPPEIRADGSTELQDVTTYYPNSVDRKTAQPLDVKPGAEVSGVDIKLVQSPIVLLSGKVTGIPPGIKPREIAVIMQASIPFLQNASIQADGTFFFWRLDPGKYTLHAHYWGQLAYMSPDLEVEVGERNIENVELRIVPPFDLAGQLRSDDEEAGQPPKPPRLPDGSSPPTPPPQPRGLDLMPEDMQYVPGFNKVIDAGSDSFKIENVQPARYHVQINGVSGYVKSIRAGNTEVDGNLLDVRNGSPGPVTITLSSNYAEISGTVSDSNGPLHDVSVLLLPVDEPRKAQFCQSDATGKYNFRTHPGKYKLAVVDQNTLSWGMNGPQLDDGIAESIELSAGDKITKDLARQK